MNSSRIRYFHKFPVTTNLRIFRETKFAYLFLFTVNVTKLMNSLQDFKTNLQSMHIAGIQIKHPSIQDWSLSKGCAKTMNLKISWDHLGFIQMTLR